MIASNNSARKLWLLRGNREVPGWRTLEEDAKSGKTDVLIFDRGDGWALIAGEAAPTTYEEMHPEPPVDGLYVSENGYPIYVVACREVRNAKAVIDAIGGDAASMLEEIGDADTVLQRVGRAF